METVRRAGGGGARRLGREGSGQCDSPLVVRWIPREDQTGLPGGDPAGHLGRLRRPGGRDPSRRVVAAPGRISLEQLWRLPLERLLPRPLVNAATFERRKEAGAPTPFPCLFLSQRLIGFGFACHLMLRRSLQCPK